MTMSDQEMREHAAVLIRRHIETVGMVSVHEYLEEKMAETRDGDPVFVLPSREEFIRIRNQVSDLVYSAVVTIAWPEGDPLNIEKAEHGD